MNATPATSARRAASVAPPVRAARERILDTAFGLFYAHGIRGVGIDRIIAESGVAKATFYKYFPAKDDLVLAYLDKVDAVWSEQLHAAASAAGPDPAAQLVGMFDALDSACRREGYRGCAFINAAAENEAGLRSTPAPSATRTRSGPGCASSPSTRMRLTPTRWPAASPCCWTADWPADRSMPAPMHRWWRRQRRKRW